MIGSIVLWGIVELIKVEWMFRENLLDYFWNLVSD